MPYDMPKCRITVLKRTLDKDLADEYLDAGDVCACERFSDGQEFIVEHPFRMPEGFCQGAWVDICGDVMTIAAGGNFPWIRQRGVQIAGCTDWFRPVIFKIERLEE